MKKTSILGLALLLSACAPSNKNTLKTQLQVRDFQTRSFDTQKTNEVLSAVVEAFQDQGFMVKNVVPEVGLVSASRDIDVEEEGEAFMQRFFFGQNARWGKTSTVEATANVKTQGNKTKVRATFQEKVLNNMGTIDDVHTIEDQRFYQDFFDKIGKSIFLENQKIY